MTQDTLAAIVAELRAGSNGHRLGLIQSACDGLADRLEAFSRSGADGDPFANKYHELMLAMEKKFPDESRHETALRYIRERERKSQSSPGKAALIPPQAGEGTGEK